MDVSLRWLRALAPDLDADVETLERVLADRGAPVESTESLGERLSAIRVGRVVEVRPHPDADRLRLCTVDVGAAEALPVVCGAPDVVSGRCYPLAPVGAVVAGVGEIREARIRGEVSRGMLCSARELGLGTDHSGLMELPEGSVPGTSLIDVLDLDDHRLEVEVTANRGDLLSHLGIAREVAPGGVRGVRLPDVPGAPPLDLRMVTAEGEASAGGATIRIEDPDLCRRYIGVVVRGVTVGPSPNWLQARLRAVGLRPINNVVDATNYVLFEVGQPLHAFDLHRLSDRSVVVRRPRPGETTFRTLDGEDRDLEPEMLLICDASRPVAIAGVMGGAESEVTGSTTDVLVECALFDPASIRATRRSLGISTDASYRFERGVDPDGMKTAVRRAVEIILATAGGVCESEAADCHPRPWVEPEVTLRLSRIERLLGVPFTEESVKSLIEPLGFSVDRAKGLGEDRLLVAVPGWRSYDVTREVDLIEEIARTHGYDAFPDDLGAYRPGTVPDHPLFQLEDRLRNAMVGRGFYEAQTPSFVPAGEGEVRVSNPVSMEEDHLRRDLVPGLIRRVEHNLSRGVRDVRLFELATSFSRGPAGGAPNEEPRIAAVMTGSRAPRHWSEEPRALDLWDLKGLAEGVRAEVWPEGRLENGAPDDKGIATGFRMVDADGRTVGWAGEVAADRVDAPVWAGPFWALELGLPMTLAPGAHPTFRPLPSYPAIERDLALLVPAVVTAARVEEVVEAAGGDLLASVTLFDRYEGRGVPDGSRSLAYRVRFQSPERTLTDDDVDRVIKGIVEDLRETLGVEIRV